MSSLTLKLAELPSHLVRGIYTVHGIAGQMPDRARYLHPDAAASLEGQLGRLVFSDIFQSPESSLAAVRAGRGAQPPGYSGHNYGLSVDLDITATCKLMDFPAWQRKGHLDSFMEDLGWFCHRRDHEVHSEAWHYNWLGRGTRISGKVQTTSGYVEAHIVQLYGAELALLGHTVRDIQGLLHEAGVYNGELDGSWGPISKEACRAFQRCWGVRETGLMDARTYRTLAYVTADRELVAGGRLAA